MEKINLRDKNIHYCIGCESCYTSGKCIFEDDMLYIRAKMLEADVIVLATPVYFYCMTAQLKTMIDRCVSFYEELENKEFYFLITATDDNKMMLDKCVESLRAFAWIALQVQLKKA